MKWGKQIWYCPNCGSKHYDGGAEIERIAALTIRCSEGCYKEWNLKNARTILAKDQLPNEPNNKAKT